MSQALRRSTLQMWPVELRRALPLPRPAPRHDMPYEIGERGTGLSVV